MPNVILLIVDTLRYDRLGVSGYRPAVTPHLDALATGGVNCPNHFANGCVTSVAFPSMFTSSLPFDYGGYDEGIRNRPVSFPELLRDAGYETWGVVTGHPCSSHFGYGRGFENLLDLIDLYQWFRSVYIASLRELRDLRHSGEITESELIVRFAPKFRRVLDDSERFIDELDRVKAPRSGRPRQTLRAMVRAERIVFESDPMASWTKIDVLGPDYQFALGEAVLTPNRRHRIFRRKSLFARINQRIHLVSNRRAFDAGEVNRQFGQFLAKRTDRPFFALLHYFDLHEAKLQVSRLLAGPTPGRISDMVRAYRRIRRGRPPGQRGILYDLGLSQVDDKVGELLQILRRAGLADDTVLVITGDHGTEAGNPHRGLGSDLARLFYDEHLHVPFIVNGPGIGNETIDSLMSHLDLAPTILDLAGVAVPEVFQGHPVWARRDNPAAVVVSENAGRGLCRIGEKPLFLAVRSRSHKTIARAENFEPEILEFYDLSQDPFECNNQAGCAGHEEIRREHLTQIRARLSRLRTETDASEGRERLVAPATEDELSD